MLPLPRTPEVCARAHSPEPSTGEPPCTARDVMSFPPAKPSTVELKGNDMKNNILNNSSTTNSAADTPQPGTKLTPEVVIEQLRAMREQMPDLTPITPKQRQVLRRQGLTSEPVLQASLNVIGASDNVSSAVGQPIEGVRVMQDDSNRWTAVEDDLRDASERGQRCESRASSAARVARRSGVHDRRAARARPGARVLYRTCGRSSV